MIQAAVTILGLIAIYAVIIVVVVRLIRRFEIGTGRAILAGLLIFGLGTGILAAFLWPHDSSVLVNFLGVWLGDWIYVRAIEWIGNPHSSQAHDTIPWVFQIPQVYVLASSTLFALMGLALEWIYQHSHSR